MRVAIFTNTYYPTLNGVANCVEAYRIALEARGHEVSIFAPCPDDYDKELDRDRVHRFAAVPLPGDWEYDIAVPYSRSVMDALKEVDFDIVHTQHPVWVGVWGQWFAQWAGLPLVTTVHTEYELYTQLVPLPEQLVDAYLKTRVTTYCNKCHVVTTPVQSTRGRLRQQGVVTPIEILHNPIDLSKLPVPDPGRIRPLHGLSDTDFVMGFIGRLAPEKSLKTVLKAAEIVMKRRDNARFLMVGSGAEMKHLKAHTRRLGIGDRVIFVGPVDHSEVPHYQAALDVFVTASMSETQPLSYTEAMAVGTPMVAVKAPGAQDMIQHNENGLLSLPDDGPRGMAEQILRISDDADLRQRIIGTAKECVKQYDISAVTDRLLEIYEAAIAAKSREAF